uniref:XRN_M domain-containing protein n=1 Tax=Macrostomum lignano TaxID=282301 RepID=A0A1I8FHQ4_9PLAT
GKMGLQFDETERRRQTREYVRGLQWVLYYYYRGVPSWGWFYRSTTLRDYISDVRDFADLDLQFDLGHPFLPFQQLMAVLPAASGPLLPRLPPAAHGLGRLARAAVLPGRAVVLIPFIDEDELLAAMRPRLPQLTEEERAQELLPAAPVFQWDPASATAGAPRSRPFGFRISADKLAPPVCRAAHLPGFPVLRGLPFTPPSCAKPARGENTVLTLTDCEFDEDRVQRAAAALLGKNCAGRTGPHLSEVHAGAVSSTTRRYTLGPDERHPLSDRDAALMKSQWDWWRQESWNRVRHLRWRRDALSADRQRRCWAVCWTSTGTAPPGKRPSGRRVRCPSCCSAACQSRCRSPGPPCAMEDVLPVGELAFVAKGNWYGMSGPTKVRLQLRVKAASTDLSVVDSEDCFLSAQALAQRTGFSGHPGVPASPARCWSLLPAAAEEAAFAIRPGRQRQLVGDGHPQSRRLNIGLELKFNRLSSTRVAGPGAVRLCAEFPELFRCLAGKHGSDTGDLSAEQIWGGAEPPVERLTEFLRSLRAKRSRAGLWTPSWPKLPKPDVSATDDPGWRTCTAASPTPSTASPTRRCPPPQGRAWSSAGRDGGPPLDPVWNHHRYPACVRESDPELELLLDEPFEGASKIRGVDGCCLHGERTKPQHRGSPWPARTGRNQHVQLWADLAAAQAAAGQSKPAGQGSSSSSRQQQQSSSSRGRSTSQPWCPPCSSSSLCRQTASPARNQPTAEHESQRLLNSLLAEWDWPVPAIDFQVYGDACSAVVRIPQRLRDGGAADAVPARGQALMCTGQQLTSAVLIQIHQVQYWSPDTAQ